MPENHFSSRDEFDRFMHAIDSEMRAQKIPIAGRELKAASLASERLGTALPIAPLPDRKPIEGVYVGEDLSLHIRAWIQAKYGEKLKVNWGPGTVPVLVDGDLYAMSLPLLFGRVRIVAHPATHHKNFDKHAALPTTVCNVLDFIEGLTTVVSASLSQEALTSIMKLFCVALESFAFIGRAPSSELINAAQADLESASQSILAAHYGLSRWASLQATEKLYKAYISSMGKPLLKTHDLIKLNASSRTLGFEGLPDNILNKICCNASVRYDGSKSTLQQAFDAYWASLQASGLIAKEMTSIV